MEIELYRKLNEVNPLDAIDRMGQWFAASAMFGCAKVEQGKMLALICVTEGLTPVQVRQKYHLATNGQLLPKSHRILSDFRRLGGKHKWIKDGQDGIEAVLELTLDGQTIQYASTIALAKAQGMVKKDSAWDKRPGNMLRADCIRNGVPMLAPEIIGDDIDEDMAPAAPVAPLFPKTSTTATVTVAAQPAIEAEIIPAVASPSAEKPGESAVPTTAPVSSPALIKVELGPDGRVAENAILFFLTLVKQRGADFDEKALTWLEKQNYITDRNVRTISQERLQRILGNFEKWASVVEAVK